MKFSSIPRFPQFHYQCNVPLGFIEKQLDSWIDVDGSMSPLQLCPDFQRGHVWSEDQQISFMEYFLRGGTSGKDIYFNHPGWMGSFDGDFVLVDGLQRLNAALAFVRDELLVFGARCSEYDLLPMTDTCFNFHVARLQTRVEVLQWYVDFNVGGTPHAAEEIERVRQLIKQEARDK